MMASLPEYRFRHRELGEIIGLARGDDVVQFRGLPFADLPGRFRQSRVRNALPHVPFDARLPGPYCPQPLLPFPSYWDGGLPPDWPALPMPSQDEFGCLNVGISVPRAALEDNIASKLPILFFIHGGAFVGGSQSVQLSGREILDGTEFERAAIARGQPLIIVTCNYRVGPLGFLASEELAAFNKSHGEPVGNYGLHDQRQALEWCAKFISGFGGDPGNVTVQGTSAGGSSAHYLATFPHRRFKRAILASGTSTGIGPMPVDHHQQLFDKYRERAVTAKAGPGDADAVSLVQSLPIEDMIRPVSGDIWHPVIDGDWVAGQRVSDVKDVYHGDAPELMVGACDFEADLTEAVLGIDMATGTPLPDAEMLAKANDFFRSNGMISHLHSFPVSHPDIAKAYSIDSALNTPSTALPQWAQLLADLAFRIPPLHLAQRHTASDVLVYDMRTTNPYPKWTLAYGKANHAINDLFVFNVAEDQVPEELRERHRQSVAQVRAAWLDFCYGKQPWRPMRREGDSLGPLFSFEDGLCGRESDTLEEAVGGELAAKWRLIMKIADEAA